MYYDEIARGYDDLYRKEQLRKISLIKEQVKFKEDDKVLDIGCGPYYGHWPGIVVGIDPSWELLKKADCIKVQGHAENLPFDDHSFNIVVTITAIHNFKDIDKALDEMLRVGKDRFVISILKKSKKCNAIQDQILKRFVLTKKIEDSHDIILILTAKYKNHSKHFV